MKINWFKIEKKKIIEKFKQCSSANSNFLRWWFSVPLIYLKQGYYCKDCFLPYFDCKCNYCENCKYRICMCNLLNLTNKEVEIQIVRFIKYNFSKEINWSIGLR